ncbi:MAG: hypothetical protein H0T82_10725 [Sphingomonas sp.]|nr:hypothetical protein [Sphingomonas sp.]
MAKPPKFRGDGAPDGRGHADGSRATRFAAGDNRRRPGRTKGSKSLKHIYLDVAATPVLLDRDGRKKKISTTHGIVMKQREKALKGDQRASEHFLDRITEYSPPDAQLDLTAKLLEEDALLLAAARPRGIIGETEPDSGSGEGDS